MTLKARKQTKTVMGLLAWNSQKRERCRAGRTQGLDDLPAAMITGADGHVS